MAFMVVGQSILGIVPIMVVGALIFFLGIDLLREALVEPIGKVNRLEYLTVSFTILSCLIRSHAYIFTLHRSSSSWYLWARGILCTVF